MAAAPQFRLEVGTLASAAFGILLRNIVPFLFLSILIFMPWIAFEFWLAEAELEPERVLLLRPVALLLQFLLSMILTGAITYGVVMHMRGTPASIGDTIGKGLSSLLRVLGTGLYCGLQIFAMTLLLIVPGIIRSIQLYAAIPAAVMENVGAAKAAQRSEHLVRGSGRAIMGAWSLVVLLGVVLGGIAGALAVATDNRFDPENPWFVVSYTLLSQTFGATMMACAYFLLRRGKENIDVESLAKVFD